MLAKIALSAATFAIDRPYSYRVPAQLENLLEPGMRVLVPFGKGNRSSEGLVLSLEQAEETHRLKEIQTLLDRRPVLTPEGIQLALWMRERFFCTVYAAALTMLPTGLWYVLKEGYALAPGVDRETWEAKTAGHPRARQVMTLLHGAGGRADLAQIRAIPDGKDPRGVLRELEKAGLVVRETQARRKVKDKTEQIASLAVDPAEALARMEPRRKTAPMGYEVTSLLCNLGSASVKELCYFTGASHQTVKSLEKRGILRLQEREVFRHQLPDIRQTQPLSPLNEAQQAAYEGLRALMNGGKPEAALLYGVTGSGKTQVYLHLIEQTLAAGRGAIVMVPEIALTPSLLQLFLTHFGRQVAVLHSCLSTGERYDEWKRVRDGQASVVIGTRSAVFAPLADVGLMILDEEQESSYQSESMVRYHAREVAKFRCTHHKGLLLLGSATPAVESRYAAEMGQYHLFTLRQRYNAHQMPKVRLVDMKQELRAGKRHGPVRPAAGRTGGKPPAGGTEHSLSQPPGQQPYGGMQPVWRGAHLSPVLGSSDLSQRQWQADVPLLRPFPAPAGALPPLLWPAPVCGHGHPKTPGGAGGELFPGWRSCGWTRTPLQPPNPTRCCWTGLRWKQVPILLGTQMVAKGLDFANVTLVGVVDGDLSLYADNYRAAERTFSLLTQVVGRAGRGEKLGRAVIQTWTPDNDVINLAARQDYDTFYEEEREMRRMLRFPPFLDLFRITLSGPEETQVLRACAVIRRSLEPWVKPRQQGPEGPEVLGPAPAPVLKVNNRYRYRVLLKCRNGREIRAVLAQILQAAQQDRANRGLSIAMDVNPMD